MMTRIHSAAAVAVDDHRRLYVRLSVPNSDGDAYEQYLFDISSSQNKEKENIYFPCFHDDCVGGFCGGLLYLHHIKGKTVILNPIRREFKFLPPSRVKRPAGTNYSYYRACGLGFDSQSNDYKVVRFVTNYCRTVHDNGETVLRGILDSQVELYSLKNNSWKEISAPKVRVENCGVYVNNKCYWISYSPFSMISFDFEKESLSSFIPMPKALPTMHSLTASNDDPDVFDGLCIFEYMGSLAAIGYKKSGLCTLFEAYTLKEQEYQWKKEFVVKVFGDHKPLGFGENGRSLFLEGNYADNKCYQLGVFDLIDGYLEKLPIFADESDRMEILPCFYDDPDVTVVLPGAEQFFVDERMEIENPKNLHPCRNFGSKSMASRRQVSLGCTEQGQGLNKKRAAASSSEENKDYQLQVFDFIARYLKELPIFVYEIIRMEIFPCDYLDANIFSRVESTDLHPGAKKFIVDEHMEMKIPKNPHLYRNFGSKSMASGQQVSLGCTEQGQGLNKKRAAASSSEENKDYQLQLFDFIDQYLKELPIFVYEIIRMEIFPCDDLDANIFSRVESTDLHTGAKKFIVDEHMEMKIPKNPHQYRNFGSKSMASGQQVSVGCTEQGQGLNKRRAAVGHDSLRPETTTSTMCVKREQHPILHMNKVSVGCTEQGQGLNKRRAAVGRDSLRPETTTSTVCVKRSKIPSRP